MVFRRKSKKNNNKKRNFVEHDYEDFLGEKIEVPNPSDIPTTHKELDSLLHEVFKDCDDFNTKQLTLPSEQHITMYYISGLFNEEYMYASVIEPFILRKERNNETPVKQVKEVIYSPTITEPPSWKQLIQDCLNGKVICHIHDLKPVTIGIITRETRGINEPSTEYQVYGPKMGLIESARTNISMIRNFIHDPRLKVKEFELGSLSHTQVAVLYLEEYVDPELRDQVLSRIQEIDDDNLVISGQLEHHLVDYPMSMFPQTHKTERPDYCSFALSQGKMVIIVDNSTFALVLPTTLMEFYNTTEDHFYKPGTRAFIRIMRFISLFLAATFPAMYVALVAFHPELIPTTLALTLAESRIKIPFPAIVEALMLMFALDVLVEATMRLPSAVGQTIGIVGAIVLGTAVVEAGIVSNVLVIVISFTAIAAFTVPSWELAQSWRLVRYILLILSSFLGLFGVILGICLITIHLCHLHSFSKPYYSPLSPLNPKEFLNVFVRLIPRKKRT
jgi:hypothetical protein